MKTQRRCAEQDWRFIW